MRMKISSPSKSDLLPNDGQDKAEIKELGGQWPGLIRLIWRYRAPRHKLVKFCLEAPYPEIADRFPHRHPRGGHGEKASCAALLQSDAGRLQPTEFPPAQPRPAPSRSRKDQQQTRSPRTQCQHLTSSSSHIRRG